LKKSQRMRKKLAYSLGSLFVIYALLLIPEPAPVQPPPPPVSRTAGVFAWQQDDFWNGLEKQFQEIRRIGCAGAAEDLSKGFTRIRVLLATLEKKEFNPADPVFSLAEQAVFTVAPYVAGCPERFPEFMSIVVRLRDAVKRQSRRWSMDDRIVRETMYRLMYGSRAALEEVMLQMPEEVVPDLIRGTDEVSSTPSAEMLGVRLHSGDILISRGGAPTSALIARGNDFPGNFSHVALVHVDSATRNISILESHIERGVTVSTMEVYLADTKLRIMVMRLRADLPAILSDPLIPHTAARLSLTEALQRHIPYDFAMDYTDPEKLFCSEVASSVYRSAGIRLWTGLSTLSQVGVRSWLGDFGVRHFETQEPSDLEYDPQLVVVAEWRDPETLYKDHIDNAATEVMLEGADRGDRLTYDHALLPVVRVVKAYSWVLNVFGGVGPVPEGMSATAALKNTMYSERHAEVTQSLSNQAFEFKKSRGYTPPYWQLLAMARKFTNAKNVSR